jgi:RNA 2',3'-cyclic 3'-phosphodiesterase
MKDSIRLFVAATLPGEVRTFLQEQAHAYSHPSLRMVPEQNLHLTLFFIGNTFSTELSGIKKKLHALASKYTAFKLQYVCTESGPDPKSPRLVWARFSQEPSFEKLSRSLAKALLPDMNTKLKPIPHITLARYRKDVPTPSAIYLQQSEPGISFLVDSFSLWQSDLASPHPLYQVLETYYLTLKQ